MLQQQVHLLKPEPQHVRQHRALACLGRAQEICTHRLLSSAASCCLIPSGVWLELARSKMPDAATAQEPRCQRQHAGHASSTTFRRRKDEEQGYRMERLFMLDTAADLEH